MAIRTYGLSGSGMDVDQMVKDLMKARRTAYDKVWQKKTQVEWKKKDLNTLYTLTQDFRNKAVYDFKKQNNLQPKSVTSTNDLVVSATANGDAANVTHSLVVKRLAEGVTWSSAANLTAEGKSKNSLVTQFDGIEVDKPLEFTINGKQIKLDVKADTSINDVVNKINSAGAGVIANYDATLDRFFLYSEKTGDASRVDFSGSTAKGLDFFGNKLQLGADLANANPADSDYQKKVSKNGLSALVVLDGVEMKQDSNQFQVSSVFYNLKTKSPQDADGYIATKIAIKPDIEKTIANVKAFVDDYNSFLSVYNTELTEDKYRDFMPLTDEQKKDLKDSEITAWEAKAKSGMLRRDPILTQTVETLRLSFVEPVKGLTGKYRSAVDIGIGTGKYIDSEGNFNSEFKNPGKLYVDEKTLREALEQDPDAVFKIFGTSGDTVEESGVANKLYAQLNTAMSRLKVESGLPDSVDKTSNLAKQLTSYNNQLASMMDSLTATEERYYKQFNAMETALANLSKQSSWLAQQFSK